MTLGALFTTVGAGLLYTLNLDLNTAHYIGYQLMVGTGVGLAIQVPMIAAQTFSEPFDIPVVSASVLCKLHLISSFSNSFPLSSFPLFAAQPIHHTE